MYARTYVRLLWYFCSIFLLTAYFVLHSIVLVPLFGKQSVLYQCNSIQFIALQCIKKCLDFRGINISFEYKNLFKFETEWIVYATKRIWLRICYVFSVYSSQLSKTIKNLYKIDYKTRQNAFSLFARNICRIEQNTKKQKAQNAQIPTNHQKYAHIPLRSAFYFQFTISYGMFFVYMQHTRASKRLFNITIEINTVRRGNNIF